jgi:two-component system sensor histidine kinase HydH
MLRGALFLFLLLSSFAILYTTFQNDRSAQNMADQALESTALALASTIEAELRSGDTLENIHVQRLFSDRIVAYGLVVDNQGNILFHSNSSLIGTLMKEKGLGLWLETGKAYGRRIILKTGLPAFEFNYPIHLPKGRAELLRLVLHTYPADQIIVRAHRMWWTVGTVLIILWIVGLLFERLLARQFRLQEALQRKEQLALIGQMTALLAHEIRNALGGIKGYTQWINEKMEKTDTKKMGLALVLKGIDRIESLVNDLLLFSRDEAYRLEAFEIGPVIQEVITSESPSEETQIEALVEPGIKVLADAEKLRRVLLNGLQNALQAMEESGTLRITAVSTGKWVEIRIEDYGPGIPEEELPRLFTPFHTTKTNGTGLGLAYSKKMVEGMGGTITLFNHPDHPGAALIIKLPKVERS